MSSCPYFVDLRVKETSIARTHARFGHDQVGQHLVDALMRRSSAAEGAA